MKGNHGSLLLSLSRPLNLLFPLSFSLQHISSSLSLSPTTAPRKIAIYGIQEDNKELIEQQRKQVKKGQLLSFSPVSSFTASSSVLPAGVIFLGEFEYDLQGKQIQSWNASTSSTLPSNLRSIRILRIDILSNQGNPDYTCVYRIRVHGEPR